MASVENDRDSSSLATNSVRIWTPSSEKTPHPLEKSALTRPPDTQITTPGPLPSEGAPGHAADGADLQAPALPKLRYVLLVTGPALGLFLSMLDSSIVATSMLTIAAEFGDVDSINWVALAYTLTYLSCAVLFARVSDVVGRRAAFAAGYVIFIVFSLACGCSQSMQQLIAFRALQGLGGSGLYSVSMIILPELTPDRNKKYIAAIVGVVLASSGVLGPVLGGILTQYTSWRWVFWINGPIGGVSLAVFIFAWPAKEHLPALERRLWKEVDFVGAFLLMTFCMASRLGWMIEVVTRWWVSGHFSLKRGLRALRLGYHMSGKDSTLSHNIHKHEKSYQNAVITQHLPP
ncbi:MFS general substrate transporter [Trichocladium antarcticum]|uniref:MFS general substrate transporter n=1 Tax=Trichocladium antarcticum TaxID=1450529 RepID=A0AAN6UJU2_9PEZI|nr:MFS general substrate transporter [Trichocladium antarcticum]